MKGNFDNTLLKGIYRDDGLAIFNRKMKKKDVAQWLDSFQKAINHYATNNFLKFTVTIWGANRDDRSKHPKVSIDTQEYFPFLDMELFWNQEKLSTRIHLKPNQQLKYLNSDSTHIPS